MWERRKLFGGDYGAFGGCDVGGESGEDLCVWPAAIRVDAQSGFIGLYLGLMVLAVAREASVAWGATTSCRRTICKATPVILCSEGVGRGRGWLYKYPADGEQNRYSSNRRVHERRVGAHAYKASTAHSGTSTSTSHSNPQQRMHRTIGPHTVVRSGGRTSDTGRDEN